MANILICDDERDIVTALKIYLSSEGYNLYEAYTGREALEIVRRAVEAMVERLGARPERIQAAMLFPAPQEHCSP